jgi:LacI family transcriptional regulator
MGKMTIKDIAKKAGVSIATVSYVINKSRTVSPELTKRVLAAIEEIGYYPDINARSLKSKRTSTIGLIVPDNSNPFFAEIAKGVEDAGFDAGFSVLLCNSNAMLEREQAYIDLLLSKRVDGVIFAPTSLSINPIQRLVDLGIPVAVFYREAGELDVDSIRIDNLEGGYRATRHLIELGHKQVACIRPLSTETPSGQRVEGFKRAMDEAGLSYSSILMPQGNNRIKGGEAAARELLNSGKKFSAIFSTNDAMAIGAMRALRDAGLRIPEDVSVIGFDDIILARYSEPPLTTISQPKQEAGALAVQRIVERIELKHTDGAREFILETELIERCSTTPCRSGDK